MTETPDGQTIPDADVLTLIAELVVIKQLPRATTTEVLRLRGELSYIPALPYMLDRGRELTGSQFAGRLEDLLRTVASKFTVDVELQATRYLLRLHPSHRIDRPERLEKLAAECFTGRLSRGEASAVTDEGAPRMKRASFMKPGRRHDQLLRQIAIMLYVVGNEFEEQPSEPVVLSPPSDRPVEANPPRSAQNRATYEYLQVSLSARYSADRYPSELITCRRVHCLSGELRNIHWQAPATEPEQLDVLSGGSPLIAAGDRGGSTVRIIFDPPMTEGEQRDVVMRTTFSNRETATFRRYSPGSRRVAEVVMRIDFHPESVPRHVWFFENLWKEETPTAYDDARRLTVSPSGHVEVHFYDPVEDQHSGLAWIW